MLRRFNGNALNISLPFQHRIISYKIATWSVINVEMYGSCNNFFLHQSQSYKHIVKILLTGKNKDYSFIFYSITPQGAGLHETEYPMRVNLEMIEPDAEY